MGFPNWGEGGEGGSPTWEKFPHFVVFVLLKMSLLLFIKRLKYLLLSRCVLWKHGHSRTRLLRDWRNFAKSRRRQKSWPTSCVNKTYSLETLQNCSTAHRNDFTSIHRYWRTTNQIYLYVCVIQVYVLELHEMIYMITAKIML